MRERKKNKMFFFLSFFLDRKEERKIWETFSTYFFPKYRIQLQKIDPRSHFFSEKVYYYFNEA